MENRKFKDDLMVKIGVEASSVMTIEDANVFISKWILDCRCNDDYKFLKLCLDMIVNSYLSKRYSYEITGQLSEQKEYELRKSFNKDHEKFTALYYLIDAEWSLYRVRLQATADYTEKQMQQEIIDNFSKLFPQYTFIKKEYRVPSGRIDILAKDKNNDDVIIELKLNKKNPNRQLLDYENYFNNPTLIGITQEKLSDKIKKTNIIYYTYDNESKEIEKY